jgi:hypothetical protein
VQAIALAEAYQCRGLFLAAPVGAGKTLVSFLLPRVLGAVRPLLLVPASVVEKTHLDFARYARHWEAPRPMPRIESYESFSREQHAHKFCGCPRCTDGEDEGTGLRPDLLIPDEADRLRNKTAVVRRRYARYIVAHPDVISCPMTGTILRKSLRDIAPLLVWALKLDAPIPLSYTELESWCEAIDERPRIGIHRPAGALLTLNPKPPSGGDDLESARLAFRERLTATPGVVVQDEQSSDQSLTIRVLKTPDDPILDGAFERFRSTLQTLDGWDLGDPLSVLRHATELGCGFYYRWEPRPPRDWLEARRGWFTFVRQRINESQRTREPLDSAEQVARYHRNHPSRVAWKTIEPTFTPHTIATPITVSVLGFAASWLAANSPALVWVQHGYVGEALSQMTGAPFFQGRGRDPVGRYIGSHDPQRSAVLSLAGNFRGRNLQAWNRALIIGPVHAATYWEQGYLGRVHRQGQRRPVWIDVAVSCAENLIALKAAHREAHMVRATLGHIQKLLIASYDWSHFPGEQLAALPRSSPAAPRWAGAFDDPPKGGPPQHT